MQASPSVMILGSMTMSVVQLLAVSGLVNTPEVPSAVTKSLQEK
jgi:hypothetical protein